MATKTKNEAPRLKQMIETVSDKTKAVNDTAVRKSHDVLDSTFDRLEKWQDIFAQTLETGVAYYGVQQDRLLTALEKAQLQYRQGEHPLNILLGRQAVDKDASVEEVLDETVATAKKAAKKAATKAEKAVTKSANSTKRKATNTIKKAAKTIDELVDEAAEQMTDAVDDTAKAVKTTAKRTKKAVSKAADQAAKSAKQAKTTAKKATTTAQKQVTKATATAKKAATTAKHKVDATAKTIEQATTKKSTKDNLKAVTGVGPKTEELLNAAGIFTYEQLAATPLRQLRKILEDAGSRYRMIDPSDWAKQARKLQ
ncbi:MAG: hypothetical protein AAGJ82_11005 [Bacteroidota bacterium]